MENNRKPLRFIAWGLLPICVFAVAYNLLARNDPFEVVVGGFVPSASYVHTEYGNDYIWIEQNGGKVTLRSRPFAGGPARVVGEERLQGASMMNCTFGSGFATYEVIKGKLTGGGGTGGGSTIKFLGSFLAPLKPRLLDKTERRDTFKFRPSPPIPPSELHRISLTDGHVDVLRFDTQGRPVYGLSKVVTDQGLFWVRNRPVDLVQLSNSQGIRYERAAIDDLMYSPLGGGPARAIFKGVYVRYGLNKTENYILWSTPREYPDTKTDWHCLRITDSSHSVIRDCPAIFYQGPFEFAGRIYWSEYAISGFHGARQVVSAKPDGSERRLELGSDGPVKHSNVILTVHRGRLYTLDLENRSESRSRLPLVLAEILPGAPGRPRPIMDIPANMSLSVKYFSGPYFCFVCNQEKTSLFDWASTSTTSQMVSTVYRFKLPD